MESSGLVLAIGALVTVAVGALLAGVVRLLSGESPQQRLDRLTVSRSPLEDAQLEMPFSDRVLKPWLRGQIQAAGRLAPSRNIQQIRHNLMRSGYPYRLNVLDFLGIKLLAAVLVGIVTIGLLTARPGGLLPRLLIAVVMMIVGFLLPDFWLGSRVRQRQTEIRRKLPDALDMLTICVDAGAGLESSMQRIGQKWHNEIAKEFGKVVAEVRLGMTRREALQNMATRTDVPEVGSFVAVLMQADQFGLSIATVLHSQSEQMRTRRWQRAEEEARKIPIKLLFPLVLLIMPAMFAVTIGPAVPVLIRTFSNLMGP